MGTYETLCLQQITETKISPIFFANVVIYTRALPSEAHHLLYLLYGLEVPADILHVTHIMNSQSDFALKDPVVGVHIQLLDVDIQLLGQHACNLVKHAHMVDAIDMDGGREE